MLSDNFCRITRGNALNFGSRVYNFRAPTERRITRESSGNAACQKTTRLDSHLSFSKEYLFYSPFFLSFKYFPLLQELCILPSHRDREDFLRAEKRVETVSAGRAFDRRIRTPFRQRVAHAFCGKWCACSRNKRRQRRG